MNTEFVIDWNEPLVFQHLDGRYYKIIGVYPTVDADGATVDAGYRLVVFRRHKKHGFEAVAEHVNSAGKMKMEVEQRVFNVSSIFERSIPVNLGEPSE